MLNVAKWVGRGAALALYVTLLGCTTMQVDTAPSKRFADKGYQTFSWRTEVPRGVPQSMESLYRLSATVQEVVAEALEKKGYRFEPSGGDFLVSYAFGARLEGGQEPVTPGLGPSGAVINRTPDGAVMDNAYALSGPREVASLMLSFEDGDNLASVWSANISQVVENQNQPDLDKVQRKLKPGVTKAFRVLPDATNR
jgi:hypothetical protein